MTDTPTPSTAVIAATAGGHAPAFLATDDSPLTVDDARHLTEMIRTTADVLWWLLARAHRGRAWELLGYETFTEYVGAEFDISRSRAYQLLNQAKVIEALNAVTPPDVNVHVTEAEARDLAPHIDGLTETVAEAVEDAPADATPEELAEIIDAVVDDERDTIRRAAAPPAETPDVTISDDTMPPWDSQPVAPPVSSDEQEDAAFNDDAYLDELISTAPGVTIGGGPVSPRRGAVITHPEDPVTFSPTAAEVTDDDNAVLISDEPHLDASLLRAKVQAAYDLYSILASVQQMPTPADVIEVIPAERRLQVTHSLPVVIEWLQDFRAAWQQTHPTTPADMTSSDV